MSRFHEFSLCDGNPVRIDLAKVAAYHPADDDQTLVCVPEGLFTVDMEFDQVRALVEAPVVIDGGIY